MALHALDTNTIAIPADESFPENDNGQQEAFIAADDLVHLAHRLIDDCDELAHLRTARIDVLWKRTGGRVAGQRRMGNCKALSGELRHYADADFLIWIAADHCHELAVTPAQLERVLFRELLKADIDPDTMKMTTRAPEIVVFAEELKRFGLWTSELREAQGAFAQAELPLDALPFGG